MSENRLFDDNSYEYYKLPGNSEKTDRDNLAKANKDYDSAKKNFNAKPCVKK